MASTGVSGMSSMGESSRSSPHDIEPLRKSSGWMIALGIIYLAAGAFALGSIVATVGTVFLIGIMMQVAGVAEVTHALQVKRSGKFPLWLSIGILYIVAGLVTIQNPHLAAQVLTLVLGLALVASGIMRILLSLTLGSGTPWIGAVLSGMVTLLIGIVIIARWPVSSLYILGLFLSIDLIVTG